MLCLQLSERLQAAIPRIHIEYEHRFGHSPTDIAARTFTTPPKGNNCDIGGGVVDAVTMKTAVAVAFLPFAASLGWGSGSPEACRSAG